MRRKLEFVEPPAPPPVPTAERLWTVQDVARFLGVPVMTVYGWRSKGAGPHGFRVGRWLRYDEHDVRRWVAEQGDSRRA
jgi:predicted DNA-binding transcriptional regulator AlpA